MSEVVGINELMALQHMADPEVKGYGEKEGARIEALLRNRQELIEILEEGGESSTIGAAAACRQALAKAKELDND